MNCRPLRSTFAHPLVIAAVGLLALNDHVLKRLWPSWLTGKLSDVVGLVVFPLLFATVVEGLLPLSRRRPAAVLMVSIWATVMGFAAVQLHPWFTELYRVGLGWLQYPFRALFDASAVPLPVVTTPDPTDLVALPAVLLAWKLGMRAVGCTMGPTGDRPSPAPTPVVD